MCRFLLMARRMWKVAWQTLDNQAPRKIPFDAESCRSRWFLKSWEYALFPKVADLEGRGGAGEMKVPERGLSKSFIWSWNVRVALTWPRHYLLWALEKAPNIVKRVVISCWQEFSHHKCGLFIFPIPSYLWELSDSHLWKIRLAIPQRVEESCWLIPSVLPWVLLQKTLQRTGTVYQYLSR